MGARAERDGEGAALRGLRVLVVEDVALQAWHVRDVLEHAGARVIGPAPDVARALALLARAEVDAAVLNLELDGERADPIADVLAARGVPFVFLTGYDPDDIGGHHAARPSVGKPLKPLALLRTLTQLRTPPP